MVNASKTITVTLLPEIAAEAEKAAVEEGWTKSELLQEALKKYLRDRQWNRITSYGQRRSKELGITPDDVERLVDGHRAETRRQA